MTESWTEPSGSNNEIQVSVPSPARDGPAYTRESGETQNRSDLLDIPGSLSMMHQDRDFYCVYQLKEGGSKGLNRVKLTLSDVKGLKRQNLKTTETQGQSKNLFTSWYSQKEEVPCRSPGPLCKWND